MAFDKHTAKLAKYYRSVGQSPASARGLAKSNSASYVPKSAKPRLVRPIKDRPGQSRGETRAFLFGVIYGRHELRGTTLPSAVKRRVGAGYGKFSELDAFHAGRSAVFRSNAARTGRNVGSFNTRKGSWAKGKGGRFVGSK